jgi:hypothetical protein
VHSASALCTALLACQAADETAAEAPTTQSTLALCTEEESAAQDNQRGSTDFHHSPPAVADEASQTAASTNATDLFDKKTNDAANGGADFVARMHGCGKLPYETLGRYLSSHGVNLASTTPDGAGQLYREGAGALGAPVYRGRVREAMFPSTSAHTKLYDILVAASAEMVTNLGVAGGACPGITIARGGKLTNDAVTCIIGVEASEGVMTQADELVAGNSVDGLRIAISALLTSTLRCTVQ